MIYSSSPAAQQKHSVPWLVFSHVTVAVAGPYDGAVSGLACEVWLADLGSLRAAHARLLNSVELVRRARYRAPEPRARFTLGAALLRSVVCEELGIDPTAVRVDRTCPSCAEHHGKPRLPGTDLHISLAHSGDKVALAVTRAAPVGLDVELISQGDVGALTRATLGSGEALREPSDFYTYWCRKEAVLKATGEGLRVALTEVLVTLPNERAGLRSYQGTELKCTMRDLDVGPDYAAALAVLADGRLDVKFCDAHDLLATTRAKPGCTVSFPC